jgi:hypothetical protein
MHRNTWLRRKTFCALLAGYAFAASVAGAYAQAITGAGEARDRTPDSQGQRSGNEQDWRDFRQDGRDARQGYWRDKRNERSEPRQDAGEYRRDLHETARDRAEIPNGTQEKRTGRRELNSELQRRDQFAQQLREAETAGDRASVARWRRMLAASNAEVARYQRELQRDYTARADRAERGQSQTHRDRDRDRDAGRREEPRGGEQGDSQRRSTAGRTEDSTRVSLWKDKQP